MKRYSLIPIILVVMLAFPAYHNPVGDSIFDEPNYVNPNDRSKQLSDIGQRSGTGPALDVSYSGTVTNSYDDPFTFDSDSRELLWDVGEIKAGGEENSKRIYFQVKLEPENDQEGLVVPLIEGVELTGEDEWTEKEVRAVDGDVDTSLPEDDSIEEGDGVVTD